MEQLKRVAPDVAAIIDDWCSRTGQPLPQSATEVSAWLRAERDT